MDSLASAFGDLARRNGVGRRPFQPHPDPLDPYDVESTYIAEHLLDLQPTDTLLRAVADIDADLELLIDTDPVHDATRLRLNGLKRGLIRKLKDAQIRDTLAAGRPPGCWCLGLGGRDPSGTLCPDLPGVWRTTCDACPEGLGAVERRRRALDYDQHAQPMARLANLLGQSGVPRRYRRCTLDNYPVTLETEPALAAVRDWNHDQTLGREIEKHSLWLWGPFGAGKTSLAAALMGEWRQRTGGTAMFITVVELLEAIRSSREANVSRHWLIENVKQMPFIVMDDLGTELGTRWVAEQLFALINGRHNENHTTIFTSNSGPSALYRQLAGESGDDEMAQRIVWRLSEMCSVVPVQGPNLREDKVRQALGLGAWTDGGE